MFCQNCGAQVPDDEVFCRYCGAQLKDSGTPDQQAQQSPYAQPYNQPIPPQPYQPYTVASPQEQAADGTATASMVCGIVGICVPFFGFILGIIAIVLSRKAKRLGNTSGKATAGLVLGIIDVASNALWIILLIIGIIAAASVATYSGYSLY